MVGVLGGGEVQFKQEQKKRVIDVTRGRDLQKRDLTGS